MTEENQQGMLWSDPARSEQFESFVNDTKTVCTQATFDDDDDDDYSYSDMSPAVGRPMRAKLSKLCYMENLFQV